MVSLGLPQLGIKTRLQDFGLMYSRHNCECPGCLVAQPKRLLRRPTLPSPQPPSGLQGLPGHSGSYFLLGNCLTSCCDSAFP